MEIFILLLALFPSIVIHEYAHGWAAYKLGDPTAKQLGRLTLNPLKHIDPVGSILVPGVIIILRMTGINIPPIGWAKPVPVNFTRLRNPKGDMMLVALAGPVSNIILAFLASQFIQIDLIPVAHEFLTLMIIVNILLAVFNMVPIPPLDGSRVVMAFLSGKALIEYSKLERFGIIIIIVFLQLGLFEKFIWPIVKWVVQLLGVNGL
ncbi:MAG: Zn-dependent protease [Lysobacterales bacterium]|jgi:Zn-dependent protease